MVRTVFFVDDAVEVNGDLLVGDVLRTEVLLQLYLHLRSGLLLWMLLHHFVRLLSHRWSCGILLILDGLQYFL